MNQDNKCIHYLLWLMPLVFCGFNSEVHGEWVAGPNGGVVFRQEYTLRPTDPSAPAAAAPAPASTAEANMCAGHGGSNCGEAAQKASPACKAAGQKAQDACSPFGQEGFMMLLMLSQAGSVLSAAGPQDAKSQCLQQKASAGIAAIMTAAKMYSCHSKMQACATACGNGNVYFQQDPLVKKECGNSFMNQAMASGLTLAEMGRGIALAIQCEKALKAAKNDKYDMCDPKQNPRAQDNLNCRDLYCEAHKDDAFCKKIEVACGDAETAKDNKECPQYCASHKDPETCPFQKEDGGTQLSSETPGAATVAGGIDVPPFDEDPASPQYNGNEKSDKKEGFIQNDQNPGGGGGLQAGGYPGGAYKKPDGGKDDSYKGTGGDRFFGGGGGGYGVSGVPTGGGGGGGGYGNNGSGGGKDGFPFNLKDFLPAAEKVETERGPASLAAQGITEQNGLSNFDKVSRVINRKRPQLKSAEDTLAKKR